MGRFTRRQFVVGTAAALAASRVLPARATPRSKPNNSGIKHIIVVMMENRSYDHFVGWTPGGNGPPAGLAYPDLNGNLVPIHHLTDPQNCGSAQPSNSFDDARICYDGGLCDGWLRVPTNDPFCIGTYDQADLPFLGGAVPAWTTFDNYFAAIMAPTWPNRMYMHSGVTDRLANDATTPSTLPTIWDRLAAKGLVGKYYFSDLPFLGLWGPKYVDIMHTYEEFLADCASGDLPHVSYVDTRMLGEDQGASTDDHPFADVRAGEWFMYQTYRAVATSPAWKHTVLVINFDEWGGFFDHVAPPMAPDVDPSFQLRGFRVPCLLISPFARRGVVSHQIYDHTSILRMIEWRWGLPPLSVRDANANNIADELDFSAPNLAAPDFAVPFFPFSEPCP